MFKVVVMLNLTRPNLDMKDLVGEIKYRGYSKESFLPGEFAWKISERKINPLSVSDISDVYCPTRRDLYFRKGVNRLPRTKRRGRATWGSAAGNLVERYILSIAKIEKKKNMVYSDIITISEKKFNNFFEDDNIKIMRRELKRLENTHEEKGNTEWLERILRNNGRAELALNYLNKLLMEDFSIKEQDILTGEDAKIDINNRRDKVKQIGINLPASPDFIIPKYGIVGDIKTGIEFKPNFQLTCTGYALAFENVHGKGHDINWGIIYFLPTRIPSLYRKSLTFAQIYIFPIDDYLRSEFIAKRNEAYSIISKKTIPELPTKDNRDHCKYCKFKEICFPNESDIGD